MVCWKKRVSFFFVVVFFSRKRKMKEKESFAFFFFFSFFLSQFRTLALLSQPHLGLQSLAGRISLAKPDPQVARLVVVGELRLHFLAWKKRGRDAFSFYCLCFYALPPLLMRAEESSTKALLVLSCSLRRVEHVRRCLRGSKIEEKERPLPRKEGERARKLLPFFFD